MQGLTEGDRRLLQQGFRENADSITALTREIREMNRHLSRNAAPSRPKS